MFIVDTYYPPKCLDDNPNECKLIVTWYEFNQNNYKSNIPDCSSIIKIITDKKYAEYNCSVQQFTESINNTQRYNIHIISDDLEKLSLISSDIEKFLFDSYAKKKENEIKRKCSKYV
jgi:hypothetical protein